MGSLLTSAALLSAAMAFLVFVLLTPGPPVLSGVLTLAVAGTDPAVIEDFTFADSFFGLISRGKPVLIDLYDTPTARFTAGDTAGEILSDGRGRFAVSIGGRKYRVDSEEYRALAVHEGLRPVLLALAPQALTLSLGGESFLLPPADSAWQNRCIDGEYYEYPPDNLCAQRRTAEGLMPTSISFSMPPENLHVTASLNGVTVFQADNQSYADFVPGNTGNICWRREPNGMTSFIRASAFIAFPSRIRRSSVFRSPRKPPNRGNSSSLPPPAPKIPMSSKR
jgi:hypothetical protein